MRRIKVIDSLINFFNKIFHKKIYVNYDARILIDSFLLIILMVINVNLLRKPINVITIIFLSIMIIFSVMLVLEVLELIDNLIPRTTEYDKIIDKIFTKYGDMIVEVKTNDDFTSKEAIKVYDFDELIEERGNLRIPIKYYNIIDHLKCNFYIKKQNKIYIYVLKAIDVEKAK